MLMTWKKFFIILGTAQLIVLFFVTMAVLLLGDYSFGYDLGFSVVAGLSAKPLAKKLEWIT